MSKSLVGYARVSTVGQNVEPQFEALRDAGCTSIFSDTAGESESEWPQLDAALLSLKAGDTLVVVSLDRLGRTEGRLLHISSTVEQCGGYIESLKDGPVSPAQLRIYLRLQY